MAATGTGTAADPYVVDNWTDFLTVCNVSATTYVFWANKETEEEKVVDFNDIAPYGIESKYQLKGNIDFNGWTIQNVWVRGSDFLYLREAKIYNLKILNAKIEVLASGIRNFIEVYDTSTNNFLIQNVEISLEIVATSQVNIFKFTTAYGKINGLGLNVYGTSSDIVYIGTSQSSGGVPIIASSIHCELQANLASSLEIFYKTNLIQCDVSGYYYDDSSGTSPIVVGYRYSALNYIRLRSNKDIVYGGDGLSLRVDEHYTGEIIRPNLLNASEKAIVVSPTQATHNQAEILAAGFPLHAEIVEE